MSRNTESQSNSFFIAQLIAMFGGFVLLLCEIRFEHRDAMTDDWRAWIPIVFSALMILLIPLAGAFWRRGGWKMLISAYSADCVCGHFRYDLHSGKHPLARFIEVFSVWFMPLAQGAKIKVHHPPLLAPAAFIGLGLIGMLLAWQARPGHYSGFSKLNDQGAVSSVNFNSRCTITAPEGCGSTLYAPVAERTL